MTVLNTFTKLVGFGGKSLQIKWNEIDRVGTNLSYLIATSYKQKTYDIISECPILR